MSRDSLLWWAAVRQNGAEALERDADRRPSRRRTGAGRPRGRMPTAIRVGLAAVAAALVAGATGTAAFARPAAAAPSPSSVGAWSPVYAWPNIGIHLHLLPNGKVLSWDEGKRPSADFAGFRGRLRGRRPGRAAARRRRQGAQQQDRPLLQRPHFPARRPAVRERRPRGGT